MAVALLLVGRSGARYPRVVFIGGIRSRRRRPELVAMLDAAVAAIGGSSTDAASTVSEVEAAETAAAVAVAMSIPTSCTDCVGQASGCGGGGCHLTKRDARLALPLSGSPTAQSQTAILTGWSSVHYPHVCLR